MILKRGIMFVVIGLALAGASCGQKTVNSTTSTTTSVGGTVDAPLTGTVKLTIQNFAYSPAALVVKKGTTLEITNKDTASHTVTSADTKIDSPFIGLNETKTLTLDAAGTYVIHCKPHPSISGTITVVE